MLPSPQHRRRIEFNVVHTTHDYSTKSNIIISPMSDAVAITELHEVFGKLYLPPSYFIDSVIPPRLLTYIPSHKALQKAAFLKDQSPSLETRLGYLNKLNGSSRLSLAVLESTDTVNALLVMMLTNRAAIREALNADFGNHPFVISYA